MVIYYRFLLLAPYWQYQRQASCPIQAIHQLQLYPLKALCVTTNAAVHAAPLAYNALLIATYAAPAHIAPSHAVSSQNIVHRDKPRAAYGIASVTYTAAPSHYAAPLISHAAPIISHAASIIRYAVPAVATIQREEYVKEFCIYCFRSYFHERVTSFSS